MPEYWIGLVVKIQADDEHIAGILARELAETVALDDSIVVEARWDNDSPEEAFE